ncbi:retrovirus-related pol polyprotein from transposon TNT 1-94 [Tanacetum coccineum]
MSKPTGVIYTTSVSRPQLKCYQVKDKVVPNNSQMKFQKKEVEEHYRISSISKKTKSVTACNDSSNSKTSNANAVCAECGTCVFNYNHDACVSRYLKDVNARPKKPNVVPISASKPKRKANKSVATPHKKIVASDTTIQKSKSYYKELYENTNQEWKWWIAKKCPSGYTWTQKPLRTKKIWMPKIRKEDASTKEGIEHQTFTPRTPEQNGVVERQNRTLAEAARTMLSASKLLLSFWTKAVTTACYTQNGSFISRLVNSVMLIWKLLSGNLHKQLHQLQSVSWLKLHQLKHGYGIKGTFHLNFDYITLLSKKDVVTGLPKLKYVKDQLCSSCEMSKAKRSSFKSKAVPSSKGRLNLLHMDLCGPNGVASINGRSIFGDCCVTIQDTLGLFLRSSKDETQKFSKYLFMMIQRNRQSSSYYCLRTVRAQILEQDTHAFFIEEGIEHPNFPLLDHLNRKAL